MQPVTPASASIVIATKNRKDDLRTALASAVAQTGNIEIIVVDDGSEDGTADMVRGEFPQVRVERSDVSQGYVLQRNRAASVASGEVIVSIDDDAEFSSPTTVAETLADFVDSRIAAVAIPYIEPHKSNLLRQVPPDRNSVWLTEGFIGTAHAVRRDVFVRLGGYRNFFIHQGEEGDLFIRLLDKGFVVRLGTATSPIIHYESPRRDTRRIDFLGRRNDVLSPWLNVPWPYLPIHMIATTINGMRTARTRNPREMLAGLAAGYLACFSRRNDRDPVRRTTYRLARRLRKRGPIRLEDGLHALSLAAGPSKSGFQTNFDDVVKLPPAGHPG